MFDYDQVHYDSVTSASLLSKLCEKAMQLEIKYMQGMNVYTLCRHGVVKEQGLAPIGTRWVFTKKDDTEHPFIRTRLIFHETKFDGHDYDICCDPACCGIPISSFKVFFLFSVCFLHFLFFFIFLLLFSFYFC